MLSKIGRISLQNNVYSNNRLMSVPNYTNNNVNRMAAQYGLLSNSYNNLNNTSQIFNTGNINNNFNLQGFFGQNQFSFYNLRNSFFAQHGINFVSTSNTSSSAPVSSVSSVSTSSAKETQLKKFANEILDLQGKLSELVSKAASMVDLDYDAKEVEEYQEKYLELYNQLAEKKAEYDNYVKQNNFSEEQIKDICKDAYETWNNNNSQIIAKYTESDKQVQIAQYADLYDEHNDIEMNNLMQQYALSSLDLLSTDTKLEKIPSDVSGVAIELNNVINQRQIIAYQIEALSDSDFDENEYNQLLQADKELEEQQTKLEEQQKQQSKSYDLNNNGFKNLFAPFTMQINYDANNLKEKITDINTNISTVSWQISQLTDCSECNESELAQLQATKQIYELELKNAMEQEKLLKTQKKYGITLDESAMKKLYEPQKEDLKTQKTELEEKITDINTNISTVSWQISQLTDGCEYNESELTQLQGIKQIYELELENLVKQNCMVTERLDYLK